LDSGRCKLAVPVAHPPIHRSPINPFHFPLRCAFGRARCTNKPVAASAAQPTRDSGRQGKQTVMWQPNTVPQAMTVSHDVRMAGTTAEPPPPDGGGSAKRKRDAIAEMHVTVDKKKAGRKSKTRGAWGGFLPCAFILCSPSLTHTHQPMPQWPRSIHARHCVSRRATAPPPPSPVTDALALPHDARLAAVGSLARRPRQRHALRLSLRRPQQQPHHQHNHTHYGFHH